MVNITVSRAIVWIWVIALMVIGGLCVSYGLDIPRARGFALFAALLIGTGQVKIRG